MSSIFKRKSSVNFFKNDCQLMSIDSVVDAAMWAPSSRNRQPWRIIAVRNGSEKFNKILNASSESNQAWLENTCVIMTFCTLEIEDMNVNKVFLDVGLAAQNAMLMATEKGISTHPYGGWKEELIKNALSIPERSKVVLLLALGYEGDPSDLSTDLYAKHVKVRERNSKESHFAWDEWGEYF